MMARRRRDCDAARDRGWRCALVDTASMRVASTRIAKMRASAQNFEKFFPSRC